MTVVCTRECFLCGFRAALNSPEDWDGDPGRDPDLHMPLMPWTKGIGCCVGAVPGRWDGTTSLAGKFVVATNGQELRMSNAEPSSSWDELFANSRRPEWKGRAKKWAEENPDETWLFVCDRCIG